MNDYDYNPIKKSLHSSFAKKVLGVVGCQLILTALVCYYSLSSRTFISFQLSWASLQYLAMFVAFVIPLVLTFSSTLSSKVPYNYLLLGIFTVAESYLLSIYLHSFDLNLVLDALFLTGLTAVVLALYSTFTKRPVDYFGGLIALCSWGILAMFFLSIFTPWGIMGGFYLAVSSILTGLYFIYDIKRIIGDDKRKITLDNYIQGAMILYIDIVRIFIKILEILQALNDEENKKKKKNQD